MLRVAGRLFARDGAVKFFRDVSKEYGVFLPIDFLTERESLNWGEGRRGGGRVCSDWRVGE